MELVRLACNGCGADIEVPDDARFVTCRYCDAKLEVKRTEGAVFTAVREAVERVERVEREVAELRAENRLLELDREWDERKKTLMLQNKKGDLVEPSRGMAMGVGFGAAAMGFVVMILVPTQGVLIGIGFIAVGGLGAFLMHGKAVQYEAARDEYERRRNEILDAISDARRG
jgi:hypothetical protein